MGRDASRWRLGSSGTSLHPTGGQVMIPKGLHFGGAYSSDQRLCSGLSTGCPCRKIISLVLRSGRPRLRGPDATGPARRILRVLSLPVLVLLAALPIGAALGPAGADSIPDQQAQAASVAHNLVLAQLQVDAARQQSSVATAKIAADEQAIADLQTQIVGDQQAIAQHLWLAQTQAIRTYINSGADSSSRNSSLFASGTAKSQVASEYASLAMGNIATNIADLHTAQRGLQARQAALVSRQEQDRADQSQRAAALAAADAAAGRLQATQSQVTGRLATAVAAQQVLQAKAANATVATAQATQAARRSSSTTATIPTATIPTATSAGTKAPSGPRYPGLPDPVLNPFLVCVVAAESGGNYGISSPNGMYLGAFQFSQSTWNSAASATGLGLLVGVPPNQATRAEQDTLAVALFALAGQRPWLGNRCS